MSQADRENLDISALFQDYYQRISRYALSLMHDPAEADDVAQETFVRAYQRLDSLRDPGALMAWLYRIATHICLDRIRQRANHPAAESESDLDEIDEADPDVPSLQKVIERNDMSACVQRYLKGLPDSYRAVILLHDLDGLTGPEIAEALSVSLATVKTRLHRAHRKAQVLLQSGCVLAHGAQRAIMETLGHVPAGSMAAPAGYAGR